MPASRALFVSAADGSHELRPVENPRVVGPIDFAWSLGDRGRSYTTFGTGPIAGSFVPGSNRLVVTGWSPCWDTFYPSTIGGAGLPWDGLGVNYMVVSGRAPSPSVLCVKNLAGTIMVSVEPIDAEAAWRGEPRDEGEIGLYALMHRVHKAHSDECQAARVLCVGPAAARTRSGAIGSAPIKKGVITNIDTWAGRGGLGSRLFQHHNLVAIVYGGDYEDVDLTDRKAVDAAFDARFGKPLKLVDFEKTVKYRFDPKFKTGGTFGSNYHSLRERALSFNYTSVNFADEQRVRIHERLIAGHYLKQFDEEIVAKQKNFNCGEPCGAVCKKVDGKFKKDYEPYQAMGPLAGVFDQRAAERLTRFADAQGFDAIQIGGEVSWVMECLVRGWLGESETGIAERPDWEPDTLDPVAGSAHNAAIAERIIRWIVDDPRAAPMRSGLRVGSRAVGGQAAEAAVYNANGPDHGCMVPNQYWVPGMFAPVPVMGRYYLNYQYEWLPPRELGRSCADRMVKEMMLDNYGMCRFHRGWAEELLPELVNQFHGITVDANQHHRSLALEMNATNAAQPWQTERVIDMIHTYLLKYREDGPPEAGLDIWIDRFNQDKRSAALAYWQEMRVGFDEGLQTPRTADRAA
jgi:glyceraldehyde-3-phosphate dehydrogenase (ferredoxin)